MKQHPHHPDATPTREEIEYIISELNDLAIQLMDSRARIKLLETKLSYTQKTPPPA